MWVKLEKVKAYVKGGKVYAFCRITGKPLKHTPVKRGRNWYGSLALVQELAKIREDANLPTPGSVKAMIYAYLDHDVSVNNRRAFCDLSARTQKDYRRDLARLGDAKIGGVPIREMAPTELTMDDCRSLRDAWNRKLGATQTKRIMAACSVLWSYGIEYNWVSTNLWRALPAPAAKKKRGSVQANHPWTNIEFLAAIQTAPHIGLARAYALAFSGVRPENLPTVTLRQLREGIEAQKTGTEHFIEIPAELEFLFEDDQDSLMATNQENGLPWRTYEQLRGGFNRHRARLVEQGLLRPTATLKGLNHTLGSALAEAGASSKEMQAAMARTAQTVEHYSRRANTKILSSAGFSRLSDWLKGN